MHKTWPEAQQISADADAEFAVDTPTVDVKKNPVVHKSPSRAPLATLAAIANSAAVKQAIAGSTIIA